MTILSETYVREIKNYLDITWDDLETNKKVRGIAYRAVNVLQSYAGHEIAFTTELDGDEESIVQTEETQLLFDCCRYIYNNAFEDFERNFLSQLLMLRAKYQTEGMETEEVDEETPDF